MRFHKIIFFIGILLFSSVNAQNMADYTDNWEGRIDDSTTFNLKVEIENLNSARSNFKISNSKNILNYSFNSQNPDSIKIPFAENLLFEGVLSKNGREINGFIKSGLLLYHLKLTHSRNNSFEGTWNVLMIDELKSQNFYLSVENGKNNDYEAYPILGDNRFSGTWCENFQKKEDIISFSDFKTGLKFEGKLLSNKIQLGVFLGKYLLTEIDLKRSQTDWEIGGFKTNEISSSLKLAEMEHLISKDSLVNTHSVLISKKGQLIYENYFEGYNARIPHDMRSASKSISSAIVGIAKDQLLFKNFNQSIFDFLPEKYQTQKAGLKSEIDI